jgi:branched-chain amino acid transport system substrate-binding protein
MNVSTRDMAGQWPKGEFEIIWPKSLATGSPLVPKPGWV